MAHALAEEGYQAYDESETRRCSLRPYYSAPLLPQGVGHSHSNTFLMAIAPSPLQYEISTATSPLTPLPEGYYLDHEHGSECEDEDAQATDDIGRSHEMSTWLFDVVEALRLEQWNWLAYKTPTLCSLSQASAAALEDPVEIFSYPHSDPWTTFRDLLRDRWEGLAASSVISKEIERLVSMDDEYKSNHNLTNEAGLSHHSAVALARLLELLAKHLDPSALLEVAGERGGNTVDWMINLRTSNQGREGTCAVAIELKPFWNANPEHFGLIEEFARRSTRNSPSLLYHVKNTGIITEPALDPHSARLLAQLLGYMRRYQILFGCIYNGDILLALEQIDDGRFCLLPPLLTDPEKPVNFVLAIMALTNYSDRKLSDEASQAWSFASQGMEGDFFDDLSEAEAFQELEGEEEKQEGENGYGQGDRPESYGEEEVDEDIYEDMDEDAEVEEDDEMDNDTSATYLPDDDVTEEDYDYEIDRSEA
ncbi:hypothetical protein V865_003492 [Kwoniella europaea PYCC6329]|uniref:Uncharacterized protein n=1 Tax=Kwoniella europaea PYCC6329 TaxID=1423913 RepID=A0AAX4KIT1_9TREE